jgi:hypothetical protein
LQDLIYQYEMASRLEKNVAWPKKEHHGRKVASRASDGLWSSWKFSPTCLTVSWN